MFNLIDIGERAGSGVPELFSVWEAEGWEEPTIEERYGEASRTLLTLSFSKKSGAKSGSKISGIKVTEQKQKILEFLQANGDQKAADISEYVELGRSRTLDLLKELIADGSVVPIGENRARKYMAISDITKCDIK